MGKHQTCVAAATTAQQRCDADVDSGFVVIAALLTVLRTHINTRACACVCERMFCLYE